MDIRAAHGMVLGQIVVVGRYCSIDQKSVWQFVFHISHGLQVGIDSVAGSRASLRYLNLIANRFRDGLLLYRVIHTACAAHGCPPTISVS